MPYRIKHLPTGLYYQPHRHRGSNLSKTGKIYHTFGNAKSSIKNQMYSSGGDISIEIRIQKDSRVHKMICDKLNFSPVRSAVGQLACITKPEDWLIEKME